MRILLIAYEFPPSPSPQSLRWAYLSSRLAARGHEVHVLAPTLGERNPGLPELGDGVVVHRAYAGPLRSLLQLLSRYYGARSRQRAAKGRAAIGDSRAWEPPRLNWKGRALEHLQGLVSSVVFPDQRGEWQPFAMRAMPGLLARVRPDVVISSHEPATSLKVGLQAKHRGYRWVADLGDPVLAPYTARQWRSRARDLERETLRTADHVLVTTAATRDLLASRHGRTDGVTVVPQGFDDLYPAEPITAAVLERQHGTLELLYSGAFYSFRDPTPLVEAVLATSGVRLNVASGNVPDNIVRLAQDHPQRLRLLGRVPHRDLLGLQRRADVLVNIANRDACQIPGKVYEYLGACRPILHLQAQPNDAVSELLARLRRGSACPGDRDSIAGVLADIRRGGASAANLDLSRQAVMGWSWTAAATRIEEILKEIGDAPEPQ